MAGGQLFGFVGVLVALPVGLIVGLLPGLSGLSALAFLIPFATNFLGVAALVYLAGMSGIQARLASGDPALAGGGDDGKSLLGGRTLAIPGDAIWDDTSPMVD